PGSRRKLCRMVLFYFVAVVLLPLFLDETGQCFRIFVAFAAQAGISSDPALDVIHRLAVTGNPDLSRRQIEVHEVVGGMVGKEPTDSMCDKLPPNVDQFKIGPSLLFFV